MKPTLLWAASSPSMPALAMRRPRKRLVAYATAKVTEKPPQKAATNPSSPHIVQGVIDKAREWSEYYGRPIHFGEFGCFTTADPVSRANFYRTFREIAEKAGIGWALWDWKAGFRYWNEKPGRPEPGMREALFARQASRTGR